MIAKDVAKTAPNQKTILIDTFAGIGGNTIAFARSGRWSTVYGIEKDYETLECAKRNAEIYGVADKIVWIFGDSFKVLPEQLGNMFHHAIIFASPPWGGK